MPTYNYRCEAGHTTERFCSIRERDENPNPPCTELVDADNGSPTKLPCGAATTQVFTAMPSVNNTEVMILDYPGSKRLKAGYVHAFVDPGPTRVSVGAAGALNPHSKERHPAAQWVKPEWKSDVRKRQA